MTMLRFAKIGLLAVAAASSAFLPAVASDTITVGTFNLENLFDTVDDPENPRDDTYLPLAAKDADRAAHDIRCERTNSGSQFYAEQCRSLDWSETVYGQKLANIAAVIKAMSPQPDVLVVPETENAKVLNDLVSDHLSGSGYAVINLDTSDKPVSRGIDVGILTKLPVVVAPTAHKIDFKGDTKDCGVTRDIVHAGVEMPDGTALHVFGVHLPSGGNPFRFRTRSLLRLNELKARLVKDGIAVAAGDFNVNCNEASTDQFARLLYRGGWEASSELVSGCRAPGSSKFFDRLQQWNTWSFLDMVVVSNGLSVGRPSDGNWFADLGSLQTQVVTSKQVRLDDEGKGYVEPRRFDPETGLGVSDHWPVTMRLVRRRAD